MSDSYRTAGALGTIGNAPKDPTATDQLSNKLAQLGSNLHDLATRIENTLDSLTGCRPAGTEGRDKPTPVANGRLEELNSRIDHVGSAYSRLLDLAQRLETI